MGRLSGCRIPATVQPILVTDDVIPIPRDQPVDHERRPILESKVEMSDEEMYNRRYHPVKSSMLQWDRGTPNALCHAFGVRGVGEG